MKATTRTSRAGTWNRRSRRGSRAGFTLLELIVALFLISVAMAVVLPSFALRENKLKGEAQKVASVIRYVNDTAVTRKKDIPLKFEFKENTMSWPEDGKDRSMRLTSLEAVELPSRGLVEEGELTVIFSPLVAGELLSVHLALGEEKMTVTFNPISRRTRIRAQQEP